MSDPGASLELSVDRLYEQARRLVGRAE